MLGRRRLGHLAVLTAIGIASVFGYVMLEPRSVRVQADGRDVAVETNISKDAALLSGAGIELHEGDRVTVLHDGGADVIRVERARRVSLLVDGVTYVLVTHAVTIGQLLEEADVVLSGRDSLLQDGVFVPPGAPVQPERVSAASGTAGEARDAGQTISIEVRRALPFVVVENGVELPESTSSRQTIAQVLREAGVVVGPGDRVTPAMDAALEADARIDVRRARALTVTLPNDHRAIYTFEDTVGEALAAAGIVTPSDAFLQPSPETPVEDGMSVRMVQLSAASDVEREYIESETVYRSDASLSPGETRTVAGHDGVRVRRYEVAYANGEEASRTLIEEYWETEPVDTVVYHPAQQAVSSGSGPPEGAVARTLNVYATWYNAASSGRAPSDPAYGRTATGVLVTYGIVAVDPTVIPLGTRMYIPGYGYGIAADTGGAVKGYIIDLGYPDGVDVDWRSGWIEIYILE